LLVKTIVIVSPLRENNLIQLIAKTENRNKIYQTNMTEIKLCIYKVIEMKLDKNRQCACVV